MSGLSNEELNELMDGLDSVSEMFNGLKHRLTRMGWGERMAEQAAIAAFVTLMGAGATKGDKK